jgi:hypothetical protein
MATVMVDEIRLRAHARPLDAEPRQQGGMDRRLLG